MNLARTKTGAYSHIPIERCAKPRHPRKSHVVEVAMGVIAVVAVGMAVWGWRLFR